MIGAVYGVGSQFEEGFHNGINRVIGTLVGGLLVIPFYKLYTSQPFGIPDWVWLVAGALSCTLVQLRTGRRLCDSARNCDLLCGYVYCRKGKGTSLYTIARILDTRLLAYLLTLLLYALYPSKYDRGKGSLLKNILGGNK